jgi:anaerobic selenocysteine-containing dehydrogenase
MVSVDIYLNETTRHADVVLPPPDALQRGHYDLAFYQLAIRNIANYSPPLEPVEEGQLEEWEILSKLALIAQGQGAEADPSIVDDLVIADQVGKSVRTPGSPVEGRDPDDLLDALGDRRGPERVLDFMLRSGPYGDGFGTDPDGLSLDKLLDHPHGIDLGPLQPRIPEVLRTPSGKVEVAPPEIVADMARLRDARDRRPERGEMVLVGRRHLRSNNSWMHNVDVLVKGKPRCILQVNPGDAERLGLTDGGDAKVASRVGALVAPVEVTDAVMEGVVSLPHGWGHDVDGVRMQVASEKAAGVNSNLLSDDTCLDPLSGNAVLNGIPVTVSPA